jgi:hypothetical protein
LDQYDPNDAERRPAAVAGIAAGLVLDPQPDTQSEIIFSVGLGQVRPHSS